MKQILRAAMVAILMLLITGISLADSLTIDQGHSNVMFSIRHIFSKVSGRFTKIKGIVHYDPAAVEKFAVDMTLETSSINTDNERRDGHLKSADFFLADSFPAITFKSTKAYKTDTGLFVEGDLTIRGITKPIVVPFEVLGIGGEPEKRVAGFVASFKVNRKDYDITWNRAIDQGGMLLGDEVDIHVGIEAKTPSNSRR